MRRFACTSLVLASLAALVAAAPPAWAQKGRGQPAPAQQGDATSVTIVNRSGVRIDVVNVSPVTSDDWGQDHLGDGTLPPGRQIQLRIAEPGGCLYDLRVIYQDRREEERRGVDLCATRAVAFTGERARVVDRSQGQGGQQARPGQGGQQGGGQQAQRPQPGARPGPQQGNPDFILVNATRVRIDVLNVSPVTDQNWGQDLLGNDTVPPGGRYTVRLGRPGECRFDVRVVYQNQYAEERRNIDLCALQELAFDGSQARAPQGGDGQQAQGPRQPGPGGGQQPGQGGQQPGQRPPGDQAGGGQRPPPGQLMSTGTGFYVSREGHVLTNRHVIEGCGAVAIARPNGERLRLQVLGEDAVNDLALLRLERTVSPALAFRAAGAPLRAGDRVVVIGYPIRQLLGEVNVTEGTVSAVRGPRGDSSLFQYTAPVQGGNSGGPILDEAGSVAGVVVSRIESLPGGRPAQNINFGIQLDVVRRFAASLGVPLLEATSVEMRRTADIAERSQPAVLPLDCLS